MKYLIISDAASMHVYNFVKNMLAGRGYDIYILRHSVRPIPEQYASYYEENNIKVFSPGDESEGKSRFATTKRFLRKIKFMMSLGHVDICHIQYLHRSSCLIYRLFRKNIDKLILSYWGTDILRPTKKEIKDQEKCFQYADKITVTVKNSMNVFRKRYGSGYDEKLEFGRFTSGSMPIIKEFSKTTTKQKCREAFGIPDHKFCVVCGYSADPHQHQDVCLDEVGLLPEELKSRIHLLVPIQYDRISTEYIENVKASAKKCGCSYEILEEYVPFERNATMCLATDIYLHVRDTDAFSNAMKEQIYSGSFMIQGDWLVYEELDEINAPLHKIHNLNELHNALQEVIENYTFSESITLFEPLYQIFSMEAVRKNWDDIFESISGK